MWLRLWGRSLAQIFHLMSGIGNGCWNCMASTWKGMISSRNQRRCHQIKKCTLNGH